MYKECILFMNSVDNMDTVHALSEICRICKGFPEVQVHLEVDQQVKNARVRLMKRDSRCIESFKPAASAYVDMPKVSTGSKKKRSEKLPSPRSGIGRFLGWSPSHPDVGYLNVGVEYEDVSFSRRHFGDMHLRKQWYISYNINDDSSNEACYVYLTPRDELPDDERSYGV